MAMATLSPSPAPGAWCSDSPWTMSNRGLNTSIHSGRATPVGWRGVTPSHIRLSSTAGPGVEAHPSSDPQTSTQQLQDSGTRGLSNPRRRFDIDDDQLYSCTWPGCSHKSSLMCEIRKHYRRTHTPNAPRPHGCPHCDKRFNWPKDVRRHIRQRHKEYAAGVDQGYTLANQLPSSSEAVILRRPNKLLSLRTVGFVIIACNALAFGNTTSEGDAASNGREARKDENHPSSYIFVTKDGRIFYRIQTFRNEASYDSLMARILHQCGSGCCRPESAVLRRYSPNQVFSQQLQGPDLLHAVEQAAATWTTLELSLEIVDKLKWPEEPAVSLQLSSATQLSPKSQSRDNVQDLCDKVDSILGNLSKRVDDLLADTSISEFEQPRTSFSRSMSDARSTHGKRGMLRSQSVFLDDTPRGVIDPENAKCTFRRAQTLPANPPFSWNGIDSRPLLRQCAGSHQDHNGRALTSNGSSANTSSASNRTGKKAFGSDGDAPGEGRPDWTKRQRKDGGDSTEQFEASLPCIFHMGEPRRFEKHTKMYKHMAEMQYVYKIQYMLWQQLIPCRKHLRSSCHLYFACHKCFKDFPNGDELNQHQCAKACSAPGCRRYRSVQDHAPLTKCACIRNSRQQWLALFRLRYPSLPAPAGFEDVDTPPFPDSSDLFTDINLDELFAQPINISPSNETSQSSADVLPSIEGPNTADSAQETLAQSNDVSNSRDETSLVKRLLKSLKTIDELRKNIQLLEQRLARPSDAQRQLESVLGMVWKELTGTGCQSSKPNSPLWNMVFAFAPGVISSAAQETQRSAHFPTMAQASSAKALNWNDDFNMDLDTICRPVPPSDSGFVSHVSQRA